MLDMFLAACAGFITVAGAASIVMKIVDYFKKPGKDRDEDIKRHSEMLNNDNKRLKELEESRKEQEETNKVIMKSLLAIMTHAIDGNHTEQLKEAKNDLEKYLINR
jgi:hypothetical protein